MLWTFPGGYEHLWVRLLLEYGLGFLTSSVWDPVQNEYGGLVMIYGTLATSAIALVIAVSVSFGIIRPPSYGLSVASFSFV